MSYIKSFKIIGLAGRSDPLDITLNRDINIFFGLNGCGKTTLLKILHAAMDNQTDILENIPFTSAEVRIYSLNWDKVFTRSIVKQSNSNKNRKKRGSGSHREVRIDNQLVLIEEPTREEGMQWICTPSSPEDAATTRWAHQYLPTSRLHVSDAPFLPYMEKNMPFNQSLTEEQLDTVFATSVEHLWRQYSSEILSAVRKAQEEGLASILRAVLSPRNATTRKQNKLSSATAYKRVLNFLERQDSKSILGKQEAFEKRYESDPTLQDVVQDIDAVEDKIKSAMVSRDTLQDLVKRLFMSNKEVRFTDESILVMGHSGEKIGLASLSSGEKHLLRILVEALLVGESSLIIDEPEISMHVDWQRTLVASLRSLNRKAQFIFATHSPEVMADLPDDKIFRI